MQRFLMRFWAFSDEWVTFAPIHPFFLFDRDRICDFLFLKSEAERNRTALNAQPAQPQN